MKHGACIITISVCLAGMALSAFAQTPPTVPTLPGPDDPVKIMVGRLELEKYKATIKGLTQFGDRRQGTDRNRAAIDWIETQLRSYGCSNTERLQYVYEPQPAANAAAAGARGRRPSETSVGGGRPRGIRARTGVNN